MKRALKVGGVVSLILFLIFGLLVINSYVYPFKSVQPNYADVEEAFAKLEFPSDWKEISSSENRGLHGRGCDPLDSSGCFHKNKTFTVTDEASVENLKSYMRSNGCRSVAVNEYSYDDEIKKSYNFSCGLGEGLTLGLSLRGPESKLSVTVKTY